MGFFTNTGALKEGEIILSDDRRHLYRVTEGELTEYEKIVAPPGNPDLWEPNQKRGVSVYDVLKKVIYGYNIYIDKWDIYDIDQIYNENNNIDLTALNKLLNFYESINEYEVKYIY